MSVTVPRIRASNDNGGLADIGSARLVVYLLAVNLVVLPCIVGGVLWFVGA